MIPFDFDGRWLARFRAWLDRRPQRNFDELSLAGKLGRLAWGIGAVAIVLAPLVWLLFG